MSKRVTVGRHGDFAPDQTRKEATRIIAHVKAGEAPIPDPPKPTPTMAELAERYQREEAGELRLRDTKTGTRVVPLTPTAVEVLEDLPQVSGNPWVFPGRQTTARYAHLAPVGLCCAS